MGIADACMTIRGWKAVFEPGATGGVSPGDLATAVAELKDYLESHMAAGDPIRELDIADNLLATRQGIRWVMPFVLTAESLQAADGRART